MYLDSVVTDVSFIARLIACQHAHLHLYGRKMLSKASNLKRANKSLLNFYFNVLYLELGCLTCGVVCFFAMYCMLALPDVFATQLRLTGPD